ncbi:MAG: ABC transporter permease [Christensenellales bacterium]
MLRRLLIFQLRETLTLRTLVLFAALILLTVFLFAALPSLASSTKRVKYDLSLSIVDPERGAISQALTMILGGMNGMGQVYLDELSVAQARLERNEILLIMQLPEGLMKDSEAFVQRAPITLWLNPRMPAETAIFVRALRSLADSVGGIQAAYMAFARAVRPLFPSLDAYNQQLTNTFSQVLVWALGRRAVVTINEAARLSTPLHMISSLTCLLCMQTGLLLMAQTQEERRSGVMCRLALSRPPWWAAPLSRQLTGLLWMSISLAPLVVGLKLYYPQARLASIVPAIFCLYWVTAALCQAAGYLSGSSPMALPGAWMMMLVLLLLGGCIYPQTLLPSALQGLMPLSPAYYAYQTVYAGLQGGTAPAGAISAFLLMCAACALLLRIAWIRGLRTGSAEVYA